ncbi:MAG: phenylalanyl-tRNA synthetase beta chain, partial [Parcubacteria group bacterium Gr01-1014_107]
MRFSYQELQKYIEKPLPQVDKLAQELTDKAFEVENIVSSGKDYLMEIKVLPDRPDCKTTSGLAREVAAIFNLSLIPSLAAVANENDARTKIPFSEKDINTILGLNLSQEEILELFGRLRIGIVEKDSKLLALIPSDRLDLNIMEDLADEVGRMHGVNKIPSVSLEKIVSPRINKTFLLTNKLREILVKEGFTEVYSYSLSDRGGVEVAEPLS